MSNRVNLPPDGWRSGRDLKREGYEGTATGLAHEMALLSIGLRQALESGGIAEGAAHEFVDTFLFRNAREEGRNTTIYGSPEAIALMERGGRLNKVARDRETTQGTEGRPKNWAEQVGVRHPEAVPGKLRSR